MAITHFQKSGLLLLQAKPVVMARQRDVCWVFTGPAEPMGLLAGPGWRWMMSAWFLFRGAMIEAFRGRLVTCVGRPP